MRTIAHLSDLHFGCVDARLLQPLAERLRAMGPDVVVVSGDLTQRARRAQFQAARAFLDTLPRPQVVVPGNHDVPLYDAASRFLRPLARYRRYIDADVEPAFADDEIAVIGLNTARSLTIKNGRLNQAQLERVRARLARLPGGLVKIVVTHHPLDLPASHGRRNLVGRARLAMETFSGSGVDILLAGHMHVADSGNTAARYHMLPHAALVVHAGTTTSTRGRGQDNSFNLIRIERPRVAVERWNWSAPAEAFERGAVERFEQSEQGWRGC